MMRKEIKRKSHEIRFAVLCATLAYLLHHCLSREEALKSELPLLIGMKMLDAAVTL